ncbi:hypothetical protein J1605_020250 [Eschrichtius robustus]|uniref:Uncharacterized protein n=1 Tax=Eschrichtius robustus TaxID=9764 RepID=A0AB34HMF1_ESCRO|nr:hypothetical protein J1605_020250 [Eschrichtius robustus]
MGKNGRDLMSMSHVLMQGRLSLAVLVAMAVAPGMSGGGGNHMPLPVQPSRLDHCLLLPPDLRGRRMKT